MLNILIGAAIGAVVNTGAYVAIQAWQGKPIDRNTLIAAAAGGAVAGALAGTTFGASLLAGGVAQSAEFLAIDGAASSGVEQMTENLLGHKALGDHVADAMAWGAATAPITGVALRGVGTEFSKFIQEGMKGAAKKGAQKVVQDVAESEAPAAARSLVGIARNVASRTTVEHFRVPTAHALGTIIANTAFGAPWVGEAVKDAKAEQKDAKPVDPNSTASSSPSVPVAPPLTNNPPKLNPTITASGAPAKPSTPTNTAGFVGSLQPITPGNNATAHPGVASLPTPAPNP